MKAIIQFDLPEEREEHEMALNGWKYKDALDEIWSKVFRPYHKHGYDNTRLNELLRTEDGQYIIEELEKIYREVMNYND